MASKMTLLGSAILAWGGIMTLGSFGLMGTRYGMPLVIIGMLAGTGGLVVSIIGAAKYERY